MTLHGVAAFVAAAALLGGCAVLHWRVRNAWSTAFLMSLAAIGVYVAIGPRLLADEPAVFGNDAALLTRIGTSATFRRVLETGLVLSASVTFLMTAVSIRRRD